MKKIIEIKGMHCEKCATRVANALNEIEGAHANVSLAKNRAEVSIKGEVSDDTLKNAITSLGFEVGNITVKKGIFG